jgi:hypothetical protein
MILVLARWPAGGTSQRDVRYQLWACASTYFTRMTHTAVM